MDGLLRKAAFAMLPFVLLAAAALPCVAVAQEQDVGQGQSAGVLVTGQVEGEGQSNEELSVQSANSSATNAINAIKQQQYFVPGRGKSGCPSGRNVGWLVNGSTNCSYECFAFARAVNEKLFGRYPSGVNGYKLNNTSGYTCVGSITNPSQSSIKDLMSKAYPGDTIQFKGGPGGWGSPQHTAIVEAVDGSGVRIYQHDDSNHVNSTYYDWGKFYNTYLDFDASTSFTKGLSLYHSTNYEEKFPSYITIADGVYTIRMSKDLSKAIDVDSGKISSNGANVQINGINNKTNQQFSFKKNSDGTYQITCVGSEMCLDVSGGGTADKTNVQQYISNGTDAQRWYIEDAGNGYVKLKGKGSGKYLDINGNNTADGTNVQIYTGNGTDAQKFKLVSYGDFGERTTGLASGYYVLRSAIDPSYAVDIPGGSTANNTNVEIYNCLQNDNQVFHLIKQEDGTYVISPKGADKVAFDVLGPSLEDNGNIGLWALNSNTNQRWTLRSCDDGYYAFQCVYSGKFLDVHGGSVANKGNISQWVGNGTAAQKFRLVPWSKDVSANRVEVSGVQASYGHTGSPIEPTPSVRWLANSFDVLRVPDSGNASGGYSNRRILDAKANRTYVIEIDKAERLAGSAANGQIRAVGSDGLDLADRGTVKWQATKQSITIKPSKDCSLYIYPAVAADTKGCAAKFTGVRVYEQMVSGSDYTVSYKDNVNAGKATLTVSGKGSFSGSRALPFSISAPPAKPATSGPSAPATSSGNADPADEASPQDASPAAAEALSMHRLYNPYTGEHFYTSDEAERDEVEAAGWTYEGVGWNAPKEGEPGYRLYNEWGGEHHYTPDAAERDSLVEAGWTDEGVGWLTAGEGGVPLYREYNPNMFSCNHNYTADPAEHESLVAAGWHDEGVAWYGV